MKKVNRNKWFSLAMAAAASLVVSASDGNAQTWEQWVDFGNAGYVETGSAWVSYEYPGAHNGAYRYLSHKNHTTVRKGTAKWTTDPLPYDGVYEVHVTYRASENRSPDANFFVVKDKDGNLEEHIINQMVGSGMERAVLGQFTYSKGQQPYVYLDGTDDEYSDCADAAYFKLVKVVVPPPPPPPKNAGPAINLLLKDNNPPAK